MFPSRIGLSNLVLASFFALPCLGLAQGTDVEVNNPCPLAQEFELTSLPFTISGSLDPVGGTPDIDFFRFTGNPGELLQADHRGASTGGGTLPDPLLGLFDTDCNWLDLNDGSGSQDSRLLFTVPSSGTFVLAATAYPDYGFTGSEYYEGSYLLTVSVPQVADSVSGQLVSARDGTPLSGNDPSYAWVQLFRCTDGSCFEYVGFQNVDSNGYFRFESDNYGSRLLAGTYQLQANANGFEFLTSDSFEVLADQALDLGAIALTPLALIGSVSGRLVDALDGTPLNGFGPPWAQAVLERCEPYGCFGIVGLQPDEQGRFQLDGGLYQIAPGTFRVTAYAEDYQPATTDQFDLDEFEPIDLGNIALTPSPIQFGAMEPCAIPPGGGFCEFGIELRNRGPGRFKGEAWGIIDFYPNVDPFRSSRFQVGKIGTKNPMPERLNLREGQSLSLRFQLEIPGSVPDYSTICASVTVGSQPDPQFHNLGDRYVFCGVTQPGQFEVLSDKEGRKRLRELKRQQAVR